jgi:hypothetical protein
MLWNCDELHRQGRGDLAQSLSDGWKLGWKPVIGPRQMPQTVALPFAEGS